MKNILTIQIPAAVNGIAGVYNLSFGGRVFKCLAMTGAFSVAAESAEVFDVISPGDGFGASDTKQFGRLTFYNASAAVVTAKIFVGNQPCTIATTAIGSNAQTYLYGNCGIANGGNANLPNSGGGVTNVACDANGYLSIPNAVNVLISRSNGGHTRQVIIFSIAPTTVSNIGLNILDPNGLTVMTIPAGSPPVALTTDSDLYVSGAGGNAKATIGQIFLSN